MSASLRETAFTFGEQGRLFGILTNPPVRDAGKLVVVIPNTGVEHRVGPNRLHVQLARALAAAGFTVLRLDISGLGDSDPPRGKSANASDDLRLALDTLQARGLGERYALIGLCSGAHDSHQFAKGDARVKALLFIDGYTYPTPRFKRQLWWARFTHVGRSLNGAVKRIRAASQGETPGGLDTDFVVWPPRDEVQGDYARFIARGVAMAFVFTGDTQRAYLYAEQHGDVFPELRRAARVWFMPHIDHTLTRRKARVELIALVREWLSAIPG